MNIPNKNRKVFYKYNKQNYEFLIDRLQKTGNNIDGLVSSKIETKPLFF